MAGLDYLRAMIDGRAAAAADLRADADFDIAEVEPGRVVVHLRARRVGVQPDRRRPRRPGLHAARLGGRLRPPQHAAAGQGLHLDRDQGQLPQGGTARSGLLTATGTVVKSGSRVGFSEGVVTDESGTLVATATSTLLVFDVPS